MRTLNDYFLTTRLADVSAASSVNIAVPDDGKIIEIISVLGGAITTANSAVTTSINGTTVTGTAEANSTVKVYNGATLIGTATAAANGTYTVSVSPTQTTGTMITTKATPTARAMITVTTNKQQTTTTAADSKNKRDS